MTVNLGIFNDCESSDNECECWDCNVFLSCGVKIACDLELINRSCGAHKRRVDGARRSFCTMSKRALPALAGAAITPDVLKERMHGGSNHVA